MTELQIQLVKAAQDGDVKSFEHLFEIYHKKVYGFARMILKNEATAEDVLQETFITAWRNLSTLKTPATFAVWIQVIAKNLCNMQLRRKNIAILLDAEQDIENFDTEDSDDFMPTIYNEREDLRERLSRIIDGLSDVQRQAIVLYYYDELSVDEISIVMECSPGTIKSRLFLARKAIKAEVEEQERETGEKFYGVAGMPMLPFGELVKSHVEALSIGKNAAHVSLNAVTNSISNSGGAEAVGVAADTQASGINVAEPIAETQGTAAKSIKAEGFKTEAVKTGAKLSLQAKIVAFVAIGAAAAAVVVLVVILSGGGFPSLDGGADKGIKDAATEEGSGPEDEGLTTFPDDDSDSGSVNVVFDYNDPSTYIPYISDPRALDEMYVLLEGYWITDDYPFIGFIKEGGEHWIEYGAFQTSWGRKGRITDGRPTGTYEAALDILIPAQAANEMDDGHPEKAETIYIDLMDLTLYTKIKAKIEGLGDIGWGGDWYTYEPGGSTLDQAFDSWWVE